MSDTRHIVKEFTLTWKIEEFFSMLKDFKSLCSPYVYICANGYINLTLRLENYASDRQTIIITVVKCNELELILNDCELIFSGSVWNNFTFEKEHSSSLPGWKFKWNYEIFEQNLVHEMGKSNLVVTCHLFIGEKNLQSKNSCDQLHKFKLSKDFKRLMDMKDTYDVTLIVDGKKIFAHKAILYARAQSFFSKLGIDSSKISEASGKEVNIMSESVLQTLMTYWYSGTLNPTLTELPVGLQTTMEMLKMTDLQKKLCVYPNAATVSSRLNSVSNVCTWPLNGFKHMKDSDILLSPMIHPFGFKQYQLKLRLRTTATDKVFEAGIHWISGMFAENHFLDLRTSLVDVYGELRHTTEHSYFPGSYSDWITVLSIKDDELSRNEDELMPGGILTLQLNLTTKSTDDHVSESSYAPSTFSDTILNVRDFNTLSDEMKGLYTSKKLSDATLSVGNVLFPVHKAILRVRVPKLFEMLAYRDTVCVSDIDPPVMRVFLTYVYSGTVELLNTEVAMKLYLAAYQFEMFLLKEMCLNYLKSNLTF